MRIVSIVGVVLFCWSSSVSAQLVGKNDIVEVQPADDLNTTGQEQSPVFVPDGLVYVSGTPTSLRERMWRRRNKMDPAILRWAARDLNDILIDQGRYAEDLNETLLESSLTFNSDYTRVYFTRAVAPAGVKGKKRIRRLRRERIFTATLGPSGSWEAVEELPFNDATANQTQPALSAAADMLVFASDREGGYGGLDLWAVPLAANGSSGIPYNLGPGVNTAGDDAYPFLADDGTLYFASRTATMSDGKPRSSQQLGLNRAPTPEELANGVRVVMSPGGDKALAAAIAADPMEYAGEVYYEDYVSAVDDRKPQVQSDKDYDLYMASPRGRVWGKRLSMGQAFNSSADDFGLVLDASGKAGAFASTRTTGAGKTDLYTFDVSRDPSKPSTARLELVVSDASTGKLLDNTVLTYLNTSTITLADALREGLIGENGNIIVKASKDNQVRASASGELAFESEVGEYLMSISLDGYETLELPLNVGEGTLTLPLAMVKARPCTRVDIAVLDEVTLQPLAGISVQYDGQLEGTSNKQLTDETGIAQFCLPCGDIYGLIAKGLGGERSGPGSVDLRDGTCSSDGAAMSTSLYLRTAGQADMQPLATTGYNPSMAAGILAEQRQPGQSSNRPTSGSNAALPSANAETPEAVANRMFAEKPTIIELPSVTYAYGGFYLGEAGRSDLGHVAALMAKYPDMHVELGSHTDARGTQSFNNQLSSRRAIEAQRYLVQELGVAPTRVRARGYGETRLLNDCRDGVDCSQEQHRVNRRTEIAVVGVPDAAAIADVLSRQAAIAKAENYVNVPPPRTVRPVVPSEATPGVPKIRYQPDVVPEPGKTYWVIVGTFRKNYNAERQRDEFVELGYADVEVVRFDYTAKQGVVVGKFAALSEAKQFSEAIVEAHRTEAYVKLVQ